MKEQPRISALDLASKSGLAFGQNGQPGGPEFETWWLGDSKVPQGERGLRLMTRLLDHLESYRPHKVFIEKPLPARVLVEIGATEDTVMFLQGVVFLARTVCRSRRVEYELVKRQDVLQHFTGQKAFKKTPTMSSRDAGKRACLARCRQFKWNVANEDEADAAALWDYGCAHEAPNLWALAGVNAPVKLRKPNR